MTVLRVCHVSASLEAGGLEQLLVDLAGRGPGMGIEHSFVALDRLGPPARRLQELGCEVRTVSHAAGKRAAWRELHGLLRDWQPDVVHAHNTYAQFYAATAARRAGLKRVVATQHGRGCGPGWRLRVQFLLANRLTRTVAAVSSDSASRCRQQDPLLGRRLEVIANGVDVERFAFQAPSGSELAVCVGRLAPDKDHLTLLEAWAEVVAVEPGLRLRIVGDGPERVHLQEAVTRLGLGEHVDLVGTVRDVTGELARSAMAVSASRSEGMPLAILEAMAVGRPVIATAVGGVTEILGHQPAAWLVDPEDADALAAAVLDAWGRRAEWAAVTAAGRARVEQQWSITRTAERYADLYHLVMEGRT